MDRLISYFIALAVAAGLMFAYDHHHGSIGWRTRVLFWHVGFSLPDSPATLLDKQIAAGAQAVADLRSCRQAIEPQQRAVEALAEAGAVKLAKAAPLPQEARSTAAAGLAKRTAILAVQSRTDDVCQQVKAVDAAFLEELQ